MNLFKNFPKSFYDFNGDNRHITNVWHRLHYKVASSLDVVQMCQKYTILDGETPESISLKLYDNQDYYWTIFMVNLKHDYVTEFPLEENALIAYCKEKYGDPEWIEGIHHYINRNGRVVDTHYVDIDGTTILKGIPINNYKHEQQVNDKKREIIVVNPYYIGKFVSEYERALNE